MQAQTPSSQAGAFAFAQVISGGGLQRTRYYNSNINEAMREAYRRGEMKWEEEAASLTHLEKMTLAWAVYHHCYQKCAEYGRKVPIPTVGDQTWARKNARMRTTAAGIPWRLPECHQILRSLRAEMVRHRNADKFLTRTELVPREEQKRDV